MKTETPFEKFRQFAQKIVSVPKSEIDIQICAGLTLAVLYWKKGLYNSNPPTKVSDK